MHYQHLLVPIEFHEAAASAIEAALQLAAQHQARTTLLYVIEEIDSGGEDPDDELRRLYAGIEESIRSRLRDVVLRFQNAGLTVEQEILVGRPVRDIVRYSATRAIDLIVMSSERIDPNHPGSGIGSFSHQVSVFCQCPVMLIK